MRGNNMGYFWELVKKEYIEIRYSWKNLLLAGFIFVFFGYTVTTSDKVINNYDNTCYILTFLLSITIPLQFLTESILSDKRNQTFERYFVSGNIKTIMLAKFFAMSVLGIIPFAIFYTYFLTQDINIINSVFVLINTPLYYWIGLCIATIIMFVFNDEKSISFIGVPCLILILGLIYINHIIAINYNPMVTCIITIACAVISTFIGYRFYKKTKYFLKI
jgi:ABC-type Na+ efflux pump permease subunit